MSKNTITRVKNTERLSEVPEDILLPAKVNLADIGRKIFQRNKITKNERPGVANYAQSVNATIEKAIVEGRVNFADLPVYADNAAALAGGLAIGRLYQTSAGALNIVVSA